MATIQRYVSSELTHFVGRNRDNEGRYNLLVNILKTGWLTHYPHNPNISGNLSVNPRALLSDNQMFNPECVCFCDIPLADLSIHIRKYGPFGLSFRKEFLITKGANPVYYIARNAHIIDYPSNPTHTVHLGKQLDQKIVEFLEDMELLLQYMRKYRSRPGVTPDMKRLHNLTWFFNFRIFSYFKVFDALKLDEDPDNYYMEREWRVIGNIQFEPEHVCRVILPEEYAQRFRRDVPAYWGQLNFSDG